MARSLGSSTLTAIADTGRVEYASLVYIVGKDGSNVDTAFGITDYGEDITLNVYDGLTGTATSRSFSGDEAPLLAIDAIPLKVGLSIDTINIAVNPLNTYVENMLRGYNLRSAQVQVYRAYLNRGRTIVDTPYCRFVGKVNGAPIETGAIGEESKATLRVVSITRELTKTSGLKFSYASQQKRSATDTFFRWTGIAGEVPVWWGEKSGKR